MITREDLLKEIETCRKSPFTLSNIEKLSCLLVVYDHLYGEDPKESQSRSAGPPQEIIGDSEFLTTIRGKNPEHIWKVMDELMAVLRVINERLYNQVLQKLDE